MPFQFPHRGSQFQTHRRYPPGAGYRHYGEEGAKLVEQLTRLGPERWLLRKLQRYVVNLPKYLHDRLRAEGAIREIHPGIFVQGHGALYDDNLGFCPDKSIIYDPDELIRVNPKKGGSMIAEALKSRTFRLKVWGENACFTRPEMKVERVSYDVMTPSAARGHPGGDSLETGHPLAGHPNRRAQPHPLGIGAAQRGRRGHVSAAQRAYSSRTSGNKGPDYFCAMWPMSSTPFSR